MRYIRRLVRNGNSLHVSMHPRMVDWLQWRPGDQFVVEATLDREVRIRRVRPEDLAAPIQPLTLDAAVPGAGK